MQAVVAFILVPFAMCPFLTTTASEPFQQKPTNTTIYKGQPLSLRCQTTYSADIIWRRLVETGDSYEIVCKCETGRCRNGFFVNSTNNGQLCTLTFIEPDVTASRLYTCTASIVGGGQVEAPAYVVVKNVTAGEPSLEPEVVVPSLVTKSASSSRPTGASEVFNYTYIVEQLHSNRKFMIAITVVVVFVLMAVGWLVFTNIKKQLSGYIRVPTSPVDEPDQEMTIPQQAVDADDESALMGLTIRDDTGTNHSHLPLLAHPRNVSEGAVDNPRDITSHDKTQPEKISREVCDEDSDYLQEDDNPANSQRTSRF